MVAFRDIVSGGDRRPRSLAVVGAKGGVGRSVLALNLAVAAGRHRRVLLLDANLPGGELATLAGVPAPAALTGPAPPGVVPVTAGVDLAQLWGDADADGPGEIEAPGWEAAYDWVVADTGSGIDARSLTAAWAADDVLLLVAPELPAVADGYATLKALCRRRPDLRAACVVNMAEGGAEADDIQAGLAELAGGFLGAQIDNLGYIPFNQDVRAATKGQTPLVLAFPSSPAAAAVVRICTDLTNRAAALQPLAEGAFLDEILRSCADPSPRHRRESLQEVRATP